MSSFNFRGLLLHCLLRIRVGRAHGQTPRLGPRASALQCGELAENLQVSRRSPRERGKVPAVVVVTTVTACTAGTAVVTASAVTAAVDATEIGPPGGDSRGVTFCTPAAPAPDSAAGASRVAG